MKKLHFILSLALLVLLQGCLDSVENGDSHNQTGLQPIPLKYQSATEINIDPEQYIELMDTGSIAHSATDGVITNRAIDPNYVAPSSCLQLQWNTLYNIALPAGAGSYCVVLPTSNFNPAKYEFSTTGLQAGNDIDLDVFQWIPATSGYAFLGDSNHTGQTDEQILILSDDGHFALNVNAIESNGGNFLFKASIYSHPDAMK